MTETAPAPSPSFTLALLGRFELIGPDGAVSLPNKKLAGLLAYLACTAPQPQHREKLSTLLWGSHFEAQAKQNLRQALFKLRQVLGQSALRSDGEFISLNAVVITCDVPQFERLVRKGSRDALTAAADLYRGRLVDDIAVNAEGWSEWLAGERERLSELAVGAMVALGDQELSDGRAGDALLAGQRANALNSMREDAHRLIMRALSAAGRNAEALKYYQAVVALLKQELGTAPDATTSALAAELRKVQEHKIVLPAAEPTADLSHQAEHVFGNDRPSVAVLPFRNMGDETEQDYFADGVTADIITALSRSRAGGDRGRIELCPSGQGNDQPAECAATRCAIRPERSYSQGGQPHSRLGRAHSYRKRGPGLVQSLRPPPGRHLRPAGRRQQQCCRSRRSRRS
ncbi:BTAD domain-containing putative transcriptional regulator [Bradyrhizobium sp. 146]|uniref:BTAD domain-containing putative transcriptional regulator n=1 Tax=Bradyrhizobium sp. 146 TaxID=2782622 RepID=UPI001FF93079|nr:BTAD domain-containing putative transcriptional regulator [Bradyrhizobium sp. 146]